MQHFLSSALAWLPHSQRGAAHVAALSLVTIQVGMGVFARAAHTEGGRSFSPTGSIAIAELLKLALSTAFFYRECQLRAHDGIAPSTRGLSSLGSPLGPVYSPLEQESAPTSHRDEQSDQTNTSQPKRPAWLAMGAFYRYIHDEMPVGLRWGLCHLALLYVLINNSIFANHKLADPVAVHFTDRGVNLITAVVMTAALDESISQTQWTAVIFQTCGMLAAKYQSNVDSFGSMGTLFLLIQIVLIALSGVYNQALIKHDKSSLHANNIILYAAGASFNLMAYILVTVLKADEPGFFSGYDSFGAVIVVASNVFAGLAITAVYKYADALIGCFATDVARCILLYISPILFGTSLNLLTVAGTIQVILAFWLYVNNSPTGGNESYRWYKIRISTKMPRFIKDYPAIVLGISTIMTITSVAFLAMQRVAMLTFTGPDLSHNQHQLKESAGMHSPFSTTLAMIRWNSPRPERIPLLKEYKPFFHTLHISMPENPQITKEFNHTLTDDSAGFPDHVYIQVAMTMQQILDQASDIEGLLYFHFDAWVDPMQWRDMNFENIWLATIDDPNSMCTTNPDDSKWNGFHDPRNYHEGAVAATQFLSSLELSYRMQEGEFCAGWSDIYYVPRRFFTDFIFLSEVFRRFSVHHEVAVPTMFHIINQTRRPGEAQPILERVRDCWGSCCSSNPPLSALLEARCGHRLDYTKIESHMPYYDKLRRQAHNLVSKEKSNNTAEFMAEYPRPLGNAMLKESLERFKEGKTLPASPMDEINPKLDDFFGGSRGIL